MVIFRIIAVLAVLAAGFISIILSSKIAASKKGDRIFSLGNAFAGGIFLGTGLVHMLPAAHDGFKELTGNHNLPWISMLAALGFFMALFFRRVLPYKEKPLSDSVKGGTRRRISPHMLAISLSAHSIVIGIALGTENTLTKGIALLIAILAYKISAIFALEVNLHRSGLFGSKLRKLNTTFLYMTPLGIIMGSTLTALLTGTAEHLIAITFDALAAGTFLYIALIDIIGEEFVGAKDKWFKFILVVFGFTAIAAIIVRL